MLFIDQGYSDKIQRALEIKRDISPFTFKYHGRIYQVTIVSLPYSWSPNTPSGVISFLADVTEEKTLDKTKADFFANASHELKTPLTSVIGYLELVENDFISDPKEQKTAIQKAIQEAKKMRELLADMLTINQLENVDNIYVPLKFFLSKKYNTLLFNLSRKFDLYIYMPTIIKPNYKNLLLNNIDSIVSDYEVKGFVISNISGFELLKKYIGNEKYTFIANYTMNIFNEYSIQELQSLGINVVTPSVELNKSILQNLCSNSPLPVELIAYGRNVLMNSSYCLLGKSNKCYPKCDMKCKNCTSSAFASLSDNLNTSVTDNSCTAKYYIKDRLGFKFRIIPDNIQTVTSIYNSKITSIDTQDLKISADRINILDENIEEINNIIIPVKNGNKLEGKEYTNGNLNREI